MDFSKKVLHFSKKSITLQSFPMRTPLEGDCQERPEGLTQRKIIGVWRSWLAHLVWDQRVQCSSHCTPTKQEERPKDWSLFLFYQRFVDSGSNPKSLGILRLASVGGRPWRPFTRIGRAKRVGRHDLPPTESKIIPL